jgi:uncharacterized iron-regulated membrane protein
LATSGIKQIRALWLQVHKWIGLTLAILIIPICVTGSALVWHDWVDAQLHPQRFARLGPADLSPDAYAAAARAALKPPERLSELRFSAHDGPVIAIASSPSKGRPVRTSVWIDPRTAAVIDRASGNSGILQVMHVLHGSLMVPGWGRTIVGWVGAFMFVSCLTGIWLWWPLNGDIKSGFRWKRRNTTNANIHYMTGFWVLIPLAMLSFTGAWISFPKLFGAFEPRPAATTGGRGAAMRARPLAAPGMSPDAAVAAAQTFGKGNLLSIAWPTDRKPEWKIAFDGGGGAQIAVNDRTGRASPPPPPQPETVARTMRRWHDGTGMGPVWQVAIFIAGIIPALLSITGVIIWWRARKPRGRAAAYRRATAAAE